MLSMLVLVQLLFMTFIEAFCPCRVMGGLGAAGGIGRALYGLLMLREHRVEPLFFPARRRGSLHHQAVVAVPDRTVNAARHLLGEHRPLRAMGRHERGDLLILLR